MNSLFKHYYERGRYYGFPRCCVRSFVEPFKTGGTIVLMKDRPKVQRLVAANGFVPCKRHARLILDGKIKIQDLILPTRKHPKRFGKTD